MDETKTREYWTKIVGRPGKFQNEAPYVPYFWTQEGGSIEDDDIVSYEIEDEDRAIFPELKGRKAILLWESSQGFVMEI